METKTLKETNKIIKFDIPELQVIEKSKAEQIKATFEPMVEMLAEFESVYNNILNEAKKEINKDVTIKAKRLRLDIGKIRIQTEKIRKEQKEEYLRAGKAIDGVSNILKWAVSDKENKLEEIENYFQIQEQKRLEALQSERAKKLSFYLEDAYERKLSEMEEDVWNAYFQSKKKEYEDRIAAEKKAEKERIAQEKVEAEERKRIKEENDRLKKEAEKRAKDEAKRKKEQEAERKLREEKERKEREVYEAKLTAEREEKKRIEREERIKREKLEAELKAKQEAERKLKELEKARIQTELNKNDAAKVKDLINDFKLLKEKYTFKSMKNKKMYITVGLLIDKIITNIQIL